MPQIHPTPIARVLTRRTSRRAALRHLGGGGAALAALGGGGLSAAAAATMATQADASNAYAYRLEASSPQQFEGGLSRVATRQDFPALEGMAIRSEQLDPGALQAPHWHPNAGELHSVMAGQGTAGIVSPGGGRASIDLSPGTVTFFPKGHYHYVHNTGSDGGDRGGRRARCRRPRRAAATDWRRRRRRAVTAGPRHRQRRPQRAHPLRSPQHP